MTYQQAYSKIITAYFKDEIVPLDSTFCFCGTLCDNTTDWAGLFNNCDSHGYKGKDFDRMEQALFKGIRITSKVNSIVLLSRYDETYEDALFVGMCAALDELRKIHADRGENVDEDIPAFTKRELVKAL